MKAVRFDQYGDDDVLKVVEVPDPVPGPGQVVVQVKAAGINPGEAKIRDGSLHEIYPATFPSGQGTDLAGVVTSLGPDVSGISVGDEVAGWTNDRCSQAEYALIEAGNLAAKPASVPWEVAGALEVVGFTAGAAVSAVNVAPGDTVVVAGAAGGVGSIAVQLAERIGATVIGIAGKSNHEWLKGHGVIPVAYGDDMVASIRAAAPDGRVDAFIDTHGGDYVEIALNELGVAPERVDTIIRFDAASKYGIKAEGNEAGASVATLTELLNLIAVGDLAVPIAATYPLADVRQAYQRLAGGHIRGKIALIP